MSQFNFKDCSIGQIHATESAQDRPRKGESFKEEEEEAGFSTTSADSVDSLEAYPKNVGRPRVLIICNFRESLQGYKKDVKGLKRMWKNFGCDVSVKKDLTHTEIENQLLKFSYSESTGTERFLAVFVLSHGAAMDVIIGRDGIGIACSKILSLFTNENTKLQGIPKLFFFQICRGDISDKGFPAKNTQTASLSEKRVPQVSDMLVTFATQSGNTSFVDDNGSWFISALVDVFQRCAVKDHVVDMLTEVNDIIAQNTAYHSSDPSIDGGKCMSEFNSTLRKKIFLLPE